VIQTAWDEPDGAVSLAPGAGARDLARTARPGRIPLWGWGLVALLLVGGVGVHGLLRRTQRRRAFTEVHAPALLPRRLKRPLRLDFTLLTRALLYGGIALVLVGGFFAARWLFREGPRRQPLRRRCLLSRRDRRQVCFLPPSPSAHFLAHPYPTATAAGHLSASGWPPVVVDTFDDNANNWPATESPIMGQPGAGGPDGVYRWRVTARHSVARWCTPDDARAEDFYWQWTPAASRPEDADYGVVFRHTRAVIICSASATTAIIAQFVA
jgi:hypothetical protein